METGDGVGWDPVEASRGSDCWDTLGAGSEAEGWGPLEVEPPTGKPILDLGGATDGGPQRGIGLGVDRVSQGGVGCRPGI